MGSNSRSWGSGKSGSWGNKGSGEGSDSPSWRKEGPLLIKTTEKQNEGEVTSPRLGAKTRSIASAEEEAKKVLLAGPRGEENNNKVQTDKNKIKMVTD